MMALLVTTGTMGLAMTGCKNHTNSIPKGEVIQETSCENTQDEDAKEMETEAVATEAPQETSNASIQISQRKIENNPVGVSVMAEGGASLLEEHYQSINSLLSNTSDASLLLCGISMDQLDFSKIDATNITTLLLKECTGKMDFEKVNTWAQLKKVEITETDFEHINALSSLKSLSLKRTYLNNTFSFSEPLEQILDDLKDTSIQYLAIENFQVSNVPLDLSVLNIRCDYFNMPTSLTCSAKKLYLSSLDYKERTQPVPLIINHQTDQVEASFYNFDMGSQDAFDWNAYASIELSNCNLTGSIEQMRNYPQVSFSNITLNHIQSSTYSNQVEEGEDNRSDLVYVKKESTGEELELFRISSEQAKENIKK